MADLPDEVLVYLLGSRYCETDRLSQFAWDMFGAGCAGLCAGAGDLRLCARPYHGSTIMNARVTRTAYEALAGTDRGVPRFRASGDYAVPLHEHPDALCERLSGRYRRAGDRADGFCRLDGGAIWTAAWHTFDPRNNKPRIGRIVVAYGRDAADVPLIHSFGAHVLQKFLRLDR